MQRETQSGSDLAAPTASEVPAATDPPTVRMAGAMVGLGVVGLPLAWVLAGAMGRDDLRVPAVITGLIVVIASLVGLMPLWLTRHADPTTKHVTGRMGHIMLRLFLTGGGLLAYLFVLPETQRLSAGFVAIGWYVLSWLVELFFLAPARPQAAA